MSSELCKLNTPAEVENAKTRASEAVLSLFEEIDSSSDTFKKQAIQCLTSKLNTIGLDYDPEAFPVIIEEVNSALSLFGLDNGELLNESAMYAALNNSQATAPEQLEDVTTDKISNQEEADIKSAIKYDFLNEAYKGARDIQKLVLQSVNVELANAFLIDTKNGRMYSSMAEVEYYLRDYQSRLYEDLVNYATILHDNGLRKEVNWQSLYEYSPTSMGYYTGGLEEILNSIGDMLEIENALELKKLKNSSNAQDQAKYKAYNAKVILQNFDSFITIKLGKAIDINPNYFNRLDIVANKYSLKLGTNVYTTWRTSEEIWLEKEVDPQMQLLVETRQMYDKTGRAIQDSYLTFGDFNYIVGKIKGLSSLIDTPIMLYDGYTDTGYYNEDAVSGETNQLVMEYQDLRSMLACTRRQPQKMFKALFELLAQDEVYDMVKLYFDPIDLGLIKTLAYNFFTGDQSIFKILSGNWPVENNPYSNICQTMDSIYDVNYTLFYQDSNGTWRVRNLKSTPIEDTLRYIEERLLSQYSKLVPNTWETFLKDFNVTVVNDPAKNQFSVSFKIIDPTDANSTTTVEVNSVNTLVRNPKPALPQVLSLVSKLLLLDLAGPKMLDILLSLWDSTYKDVAGEWLGTDTVVNDLVSLAGRIIFNRALSQYKLENVKGYSNIEKILSNIYSEESNRPKINNKLNEINLVSGGVAIQTMKRIALARSIYTGVSTKSLVTSAEGNSLSNYTLSRLQGALLNQWIERGQSEASAYNHFTIFQPGAFKGIYTQKEAKGIGGISKEITKFTVSEFAYSNIVYNFIGGLLKTSGTQLGNGVVGLVPSVNSDKNTIGLALFDLRTLGLVDVNGQLVDSDTIKRLIKDTLGVAYDNIITTVQSDLLILNDYISSIDSSIPKLDYVSNFQAWNEYFKDNAYKALSDYLLLYNLEHPTAPLTLTDQIHLINKKGSITANTTLLDLSARFGLKVSGPNYSNAELFWDYKNSETVKSLLEKGFTWQIKNSEQDKYAAAMAPDFVNASGNMAVARVTLNNGEVRLLATKLDVLRLENELKTKIFLDIHSLVKNKSLFKKFELNPIFEKYNLLDYLLTQQFMMASVGSHIAHPVKKLPSDVDRLDLLFAEEAGRFYAQHKRNVSYTAAMHEFLLDLLEGIPEYYNIAIMDDIKADLYNVTGVTGDAKPYDGATFVNPFIVYLENTSLGTAKAGINKKLFVHFIDERTGSGGIIKTAGFGVTNDLCRESLFYRRMMKKMTDRKWYNEDGTQTVINILHSDIYGADLWTPSDPSSRFFDPCYAGRLLFFSEGNRFFRVTGMKSEGNNLYVITVHECNEHGSILDINNKLYLNTGNNYYDAFRIGTTAELVTIDTNYKLWSAFGGAYSMELVNGSLEKSENSIRAVVDAINKVGYVKNTKSVKYQSDVFLPLKHSDVHYAPTVGAVKQGAANINGKAAYKNDTPYNWYRIKMQLAGIQLDKEHHADDSELSMMTQVISACASKGLTPNQSIALYNALRTLTEIGIKDLVDTLRRLLKQETGSKEKFLELVVRTIVDLLITSNSSDGSVLAQTAAALIESVKSGRNPKYEDVKDVIAYSDPAIFKLVISILSVSLTKAGIKLKMPGILSVLCPSEEITKLYGDLRISDLLKRYPIPVDDNGFTEAGVMPTSYERFEYAINLLLEAYKTDPKHSLFVNGQLVHLNIKIGRNYAIELAPFQEILDSGRTALAGSNLRDGIKLYRPLSGLKQAFFDYINDRTSETGAQKNEVFKKLAEKGYDTAFLENLILTDEDALLLLRFHEASHLRNNDAANYWTNDNVQAGVINYLDPNKINIESRATEDAIKALQLYKQLKINNGIVSITLPSQYKALKVLLKSGMVTNAYEYVKEGRNLGMYNATFTSADGTELYLLYDCDSILLLFDVNNLFSESQVGLLKWASENLRWLIGNTVDVLPENKSSYQYLVRELRKQVLHDIDVISPQGPKEGDVINGVPFLATVRIDGLNVAVNRQTVELEPYEVIMPKIFKSLFGLNTFDSLLDILSDDKFFLRKILDRLNKPSSVSTESFDVEFKNLDGTSVYVATTAPNGFTLLPPENVYKKVDGRSVERVDINGDVKYQMFSANDLIYVDLFGNEVIVTLGTRGIAHYVNALDYKLISFGDNTSNEIIQSTLNACEKSHNSSARQFSRLFDSYWSLHLDLREMEAAKGFQTEVKTLLTTCLDFLDNINCSLEELVNGQFEEGTALWDYQNNPVIKSLVQMAMETTVSFKKALDIVAARIPAQSLQSVMAMKVVGFENPNINTAYVSSAQIWLLGSDYDVDAVSLASFEVDKNGKFVGWSPYFSYNSVAALKASLEIPVPNGKTINLEQKTLDAEQIQNEIALLQSIGELQEVNTVDSVYDFIRCLEYYNNNQIADFTGQPESEALTNKQQRIVEMINRHNTYFNYLSSTKRLAAQHNLIMHLMYSIVASPSHLILGLVSVDDATGGFKKIANTSADAKALLTVTPGNAVNKFEAIVENLVGKDCIGVCAVGLKTFFGSTLYYTEYYNNRNSDKDRLLLGPKNNKGIEMQIWDGTKYVKAVYKTLANARPRTDTMVRDIQNAQVLETLLSIKTDEDAAIVLSALLSLSTDNAKELALAKLNASTNLIGMYIYGISIGMDYRDISHIMMSNLGTTIRDLLTSNIFTGESGTNSVLNALNYLTVGPRHRMAEFDVATKSSDGKHTLYPSPLQLFLELEVNKKDPNDKSLKDFNIIARWAATKGPNVDFNAWRKDSKYWHLENDSHDEAAKRLNKEKVNRFIDFLEEYTNAVLMVRLDQIMFSNLETLAEGAAEMKTLGAMFGVNLGLKTKLDEINSFVDKFESAIYTRRKELAHHAERHCALKNFTEKPKIKAPGSFDPTDPNSEFEFDFKKFIFDPEYRQAKVEAYDAVRHTFNILDVVTVVPHIEGYLQCAALFLSECEISSKFNTLRKESRSRQKEFEVFDSRGKKALTQDISNLIDRTMIDEFLLSTNRKIVIPANDPCLKLDGTPYEENHEETVITLGTPEGDAAFLYWFENKVIPDLQAGHLTEGVVRPDIRNNKFIQDLTPALLTKSPTKVPIIKYSLPIDMTLRDLADLAAMDTYASEFRTIAEANYERTILSSDKPQSLNIGELFYLYNSLAYERRINGQSLTKLFEQYVPKMLGELLGFINAADLEGREWYLSPTSLILRSAPVGSPFSAKYHYIRYNDSVQGMSYTMSKKERSSSIDDEFGDAFFDYSMDGDDGNSYDRFAKTNYQRFVIKRAELAPNYYLTDDGAQIHTKDGLTFIARYNKNTNEFSNFEVPVAELENRIVGYARANNISSEQINDAITKLHEVVAEFNKLVKTGTGALLSMSMPQVANLIEYLKLAVDPETLFNKCN